MSSRDPMRVFSRTVAGAIENSPEVEAFLDGNYIVPSTWGDYATRALDLDLVEADPVAVVELFGGPELADLNDHRIQFESHADFNWYHRQFIESRAEGYRRDLLPEAQGLVEVSKLISSQWQVADVEAAERKADTIQDGMFEVEDSIESAKLCMQRDGLWDGVDVTVAEFAQQMLGANVTDEEHPRELAQYWVSGVRAVVEGLERDYSYLDFDAMPVADLRLKRTHVTLHQAELHRAPSHLARELAAQDWETIEPVFLAPTNLSIIDGTEV